SQPERGRDRSSRGGSSRGRSVPADAGAGGAGGSGGDREFVSFEETFQGEARQAFGDLGPEVASPAGGADESRGPRRNNDRRRSNRR
ncbi:MAG: hypothetical protein ACR2HV_06140, partial [Acidimicrobiales bacterium]